MPESKKKNLRISAPVVSGALIVLTAILGLMIFMQFQWQKKQAISLFVEKGATLIQSFEAAMRSQSPKDDEVFYLQKLLMEIAQQPDIDYLVVTDQKGQIVADSDPSMLGQPYGQELDLPSLSHGREVRWRQAVNLEGAGTFEVYRGFFPYSDMAKLEPLIVFIGFNMDKIEKASREDECRMAALATILFLVGSLTMAFLFLAQAYRLTKSSLSRMTVFSEALVKNLPIALLAVDQKGKIAGCNEQALPLIEQSCDDVIGKDAAAVVRKPFLEILKRIEGTAGMLEEDTFLPDVENSEQIWEVVATGFSGSDVREGKILLARNITAFRQMEKEVARSRHLQAIASLAAGVAHEIRNPLSSIRGLAVYFKSRLAGNKDDEETADVMIAETERLNRVISHLIDFAKPTALKKELVEPTDLARRAVRLVEKEARKNSVAIDIRAKEGLPQAEVDPDRIKQALLNIFLNAFAAMPDGGKLLIELTEKNDFLQIIVSDTGEGIKKEDQPKIYDPYFTSKPSGTGLGLAIVQKILLAHGGGIQIESKPGCGTKATLQIPFTTPARREK